MVLTLNTFGEKKGKEQLRMIYRRKKNPSGVMMIRAAAGQAPRVKGSLREDVFLISPVRSMPRHAAEGGSARTSRWPANVLAAHPLDKTAGRPLLRHQHQHQHRHRHQHLHLRLHLHLLLALRHLTLVLKLSCSR